MNKFWILCLFPVSLFAQESSILNHSLTDYFLGDEYNIDSSEHTSIKPIIFPQKVIQNRVDPLLIKSKILNKLFNNNLIQFSDNELDISINPLFHFSAGYEKHGKTYINTRGVQLKGKIGKNVSFYSSFYENQAIYPMYVENYIWDNNLGEIDFVVPGQGIARESSSDRSIRDLDFAMSNGHVAYQASKYFTFQLGHGKNFIGDGYRSMFLSDNSFNYPYFKITTSISKFRYINLFSSFQDLREEFKLAGIYRKKFSTLHYLSYNISDRLNIGLFESIIWEQDTFERGFDVNYLNPIIFYRPVEFSLGSEGGNALLGISLKYKLNKKSYAYGQFMIDEFKLSEIKSANGWWANKYAAQFGVKIYDLFGFQNLYMQSELNLARPYMYSHHRPLQSYTHYGQPLAHPLGANFLESINIIRYNYNRYYLELKMILAKQGSSIQDSSTNFGENIFQSYSDDQLEYGNKIGQGNTTKLRFLDLKVGVLINPYTNMKLEFGVTNRQSVSLYYDLIKDTHFYMSFKTDLRNTYYDF